MKILIILGSRRNQCEPYAHFIDPVLLSFYVNQTFRYLFFFFSQMLKTQKKKSVDFFFGFNLSSGELK